MNLHPYYFRIAIRTDFSQEEYGRVFYFARKYHTHALIRPNTVPLIRHENTLTNDEENIAITYRDDGLIDMNWARVTYLKPDHPEAKSEFDNAVRLLKEKVPSYSLEELLKSYHHAPLEEDGQRMFAVYATAIGAPWEYNQAYFDAIHEFAKDEKATVRAAVVIGIGYLGQTEYEPLLKQLTQDENADVSKRAQDMLNSFTELKEKLQQT